MSRRRQANFCKTCECPVMFRWHEPAHHLHSTLTLALIGMKFVTPLTGSLMLLVWLQRIASTLKWGCPHCRNSCHTA